MTKETREAYGVRRIPALWAHLDPTTIVRSASLPLPARDERGEGWGEGLVSAAWTWFGGPSPSPLPSPSGRGRTADSLSRHLGGFDLARRRRGGSLSLRERVGVRGNQPREYSALTHWKRRGICV